MLLTMSASAAPDIYTDRTFIQQKRLKSISAIKINNQIIYRVIIISTIVSPLQVGTIYFCLVPFSSMACQQTLQFHLSISFLSSLTSRTYHWSPLCCYLCPPVVLSSGKVSHPSPFLDFNVFYDILDFSLLSNPSASFFYFFWYFPAYIFPCFFVLF